MGDRGNIVMEYSETKERVFFYAHWSGSDLPQILQTALQRKIRWQDESYLARIIFNGMTDGVESEETGFGIAPYLCDNEHDLLIVNPSQQTVTRETEDGGQVQTWTFEEFCALDLETLGDY